MPLKTDGSRGWKTWAARTGLTFRAISTTCRHGEREDERRDGRHQRGEGGPVGVEHGTTSRRRAGGRPEVKGIITLAWSSPNKKGIETTGKEHDKHDPVLQIDDEREEEAA
ncbi:hypothetical protein EYF80_025254 [Liparis tanakae]|uniref:Uncharacterized protein n=1 Tax=Liparis tanakae TaxID=230148 RepID=A0A4Z2HFL1_9TELE|nr:hypothetical protein EYF80_025254 [Liparis tanakae]